MVPFHLPIIPLERDLLRVISDTLKNPSAIGSICETQNIVLAEHVEEQYQNIVVKSRHTHKFAGCMVHVVISDIYHQSMNSLSDLEMARFDRVASEVTSKVCAGTQKVCIQGQLPGKCLGELEFKVQDETVEIIQPRTYTDTENVLASMFSPIQAKEFYSFFREVFVDGSSFQPIFQALEKAFRETYQPIIQEHNRREVLKHL